MKRIRSYHDDEPLTEALEKLKGLREKKHHCDIIFVDENGCELYGHKIILSLFTYFFDASCNFKAGNEKITRIKLKDLDIKMSVFEKILKIMYWEKPTIDANEIEDLLFAADKLLMDGIFEYVGNIIRENDYFREKNLLMIKLCHLPSLQKCSTLYSHLKDVLYYDNFGGISQLQEFYELSVEMLCRLGVFLRSEPCRHPEVCADFLVKWIMFDKENRIEDVRAIAQNLNSEFQYTNHTIDFDAVDAFVSAITEVRKGLVKAPYTMINILRCGLRGLFSDSIRERWDSAHYYLLYKDTDVKAKYLHLTDWFNFSKNARDI